MPREQDAVLKDYILALKQPVRLQKADDAGVNPVRTNCPAVQKLWTEGYDQDRSLSIFNMTRVLLHNKCDDKTIINKIVDYDSRLLGKIEDRINPEGYVQDCIDKIRESLTPDEASNDTVHLPCKSLRKIGYCAMEGPCSYIIEEKIRALNVGMLSITESSNRINDILRDIAFVKDSITQAGLISELSRVSKRSVKSLAQQLSIFVPEASENTEIIVEDSSDKMFSPVQDFVDGTMYYTIYLKTANGKRPYIVSSKRDAIPFSLNELVKRNLTIPDTYTTEKSKTKVLLPPKDFGRCSIGKSEPFNIHEYLDGKTKVNPYEVFMEIKAIFLKFMDYPDKRYYTLVVLYVMMTYTYMIFDAIPYLLLFGSKRVGKTRTMEIIDGLCFNASSVSSTSSAYIFRMVEWNRITLFIDEASFLSRGSTPEKSEILDMIKSGYKKIGKAGRCTGEDNLPKEFSSYCPKIFGNTVGFDNVLEDRAITLLLKRTGKKIPKFRLKSVNKLFSIIRNKLYIYGLEFAKEISELYHGIEEIDGISDREEEIWSGLFAIGKLIDKYSPEGSNLVFNEMVALAKEMKKVKDFKDVANDVDNTVIQKTYEFITGEDSDSCKIEGNYYNSEVLCGYINGDTGLSLSTRTLGKILTKVHILKEGDEDRKRPRVSDDLGNLKQATFYRLERAKIEEIARNYGISLQSDYTAHKLHADCTEEGSREMW